MKRRGQFKVWERRDDADPTFARFIYVLVRKGKPVHHMGDRHLVQCATIDGIPFAMGKERLFANYKPQRATRTAPSRQPASGS